MNVAPVVKLKGTLDDVVSLEGAEDDVEEPEDQEETRAQPLKIKYSLDNFNRYKTIFFCGIDYSLLGWIFV